MNIRSVWKKAMEKKVKNYKKLSKEQLIQRIQEMEGNSPCYNRKVECDQHKCLWITACNAKINSISN